MPALSQKLRTFARPSPGLALVGVLALFVLALIKFGPAIFGSHWQTVRVPYGQQMTLQLSDGSRVELNAGTVFKYPKRFPSELRSVKLQGEAFFQVQSAEGPFEVETEHATTRVVGTAFNVRTWDRKTQVFVESGKVAVKAKNSSNANEIVVIAGRLVICQEESILLPPLEHPEDVLAWREGRLVFRRKPLGEVLAEMERFFNVKIQADSNLLHRTITASFSQEPLPKLVEALAAALDVQYEKSIDGYWLNPK